MTWRSPDRRLGVGPLPLLLAFAGLAGGCARPAPLEGAGCVPDKGCPGRLVCAEQVCMPKAIQPECTTDADCPGHNQCHVEAARCVQCVTDERCWPQSCVDFVCGCRDDGDCASHLCLGGYCGYCNADEQCRPGFECHQETSFCEPLGADKDRRVTTP